MSSLTAANKDEQNVDDPGSAGGLPAVEEEEDEVELMKNLYLVVDSENLFHQNNKVYYRDRSSGMREDQLLGKISMLSTDGGASTVVKCVCSLHGPGPEGQDAPAAWSAADHVSTAPPSSLASRAKVRR